MRRRMASDDVPAPVQFRNLFAVQERWRANVIGRHEEVAAPAKLLQSSGDVSVSAHASIIESKQPGRARASSSSSSLFSVKIEDAAGTFRDGFGYRLEVRGELARLHLIEVCMRAAKTTLCGRAIPDHVMVHERNSFHLLSRLALSFHLR